MAANGYYDEFGNWVEDPNQYPDTPPMNTAPVPAPVEFPYSGQPWSERNPAGSPSVPTDPHTSSTPDYTKQITDVYQQRMGRAPTASELSSDLDNARRYGTGGSLLSDIAARGSNTPGQGDRQGAPNPLQTFTGGGSSGGSQGGSSSTDALIKLMMDRQAAQDAQNKQRGDALYAQLYARGNQSLAFDRNDPIIRAQADAFSAQQDRAARNYNSAEAERQGPYANLGAERRLAAEHAGQASGAFEANLMGQELSARRQEIAQALAGQGGLLTADQQNKLQGQLALLDQAIKQQQIGLGQQGIDLQAKGLGQDWQKTLLANEQFNNGLGFNYANLYSDNYNRNAQY